MTPPLADQFIRAHSVLDDDMVEGEPILTTHESLDKIRDLVLEVAAAHPNPEVRLFAHWSIPCHLQWMDLEGKRGMVVEFEGNEVTVISVSLLPRSKGETRVFHLDVPERQELIPYMRKRWIDTARESIKADDREAQRLVEIACLKANSDAAIDTGVTLLSSSGLRRKAL